MKPIKFTDTIKPIKLPKDDNIRWYCDFYMCEDVATLIGWGRFITGKNEFASSLLYFLKIDNGKKSQEGSRYLKRANIAIIERKYCALFWNVYAGGTKIENNMICAGSLQKGSASGRTTLTLNIFHLKKLFLAHLDKNAFKQ